MSATAKLIISVIADPPPTFLSSPFAEPWADVDEAYSGTIASNATDPQLSHGDVLTFAKLSGPSWLSVASNGLLSGTPEDINAGTNRFVITVTNLGGASNTATLFIYVNSPPLFVPQNFTTPAATVGLPYSGSIASYAKDPDLGAGDTLTFYKVQLADPPWLNVSTNGALSGTPVSANIGVNTFLVLVVDSGGLSAVGNLTINVNADSPPAFLNNPFAEPPATAGIAYAASIATNASNTNFGDTLSFSLVSGPAWLSVAGNGSLSGTPSSSNIGPNTFIVNVADLEGLSNNAALNINVVPTPPLVMNIWPQGSNLMLTWSGGIGPYHLMVATNLNPPVWHFVGHPTNATSLLVAPGGVGAFYQIQGK
jgi:hypothetical protein